MCACVCVCLRLCMCVYTNIRRRIICKLPAQEQLVACSFRECLIFETLYLIVVQIVLTQHLRVLTASRVEVCGFVCVCKRVYACVREREIACV